MGIGAAPDSFTGFLEPYYRFILKEIIQIPIAPKFILQENYQISAVLAFNTVEQRKGNG